MVDLVKRSVTHAGDALHLTPSNTACWCIWRQHGGRDHHAFATAAGHLGPGHSEDTHYVRVHMANLRKKIEADRRARATC